jgi:hypothetical protein
VWSSILASDEILMVDGITTMRVCIRRRSHGKLESQDSWGQAGLAFFFFDNDSLSRTNQESNKSYLHLLLRAALLPHLPVTSH